MNRTVRGAIVAVFGAVIAAMASPACVEYPQSIVVLKVVRPKPNEEGGCTVDAGDNGLVNGTLDVLVAQSYSASLAVRNELRSSKDLAKARSEAGNVYLLGATVRLTLASGEALTSDPGLDGRAGNEFRTEGSGFLEPGALSSITVNLLDGAAVCQIARRVEERVNNLKVRPQDQSVQVIAFARVQAQTLGGLTIESQEFQFPINVCWGCLANVTLAGNVCSAPAAAAGDDKPICNPGQDASITCDKCKSISDYCASGTVSVLPKQCARALVP